MTPGDAVWAVASTLAHDEGDVDALSLAIETARYRDPIDLEKQLAAYSLLGTYYAIVKDKKRQLRGGERLAWSFMEDLIEGWLKALDKGIILGMHINKLTGMHNT